jgi:hypothetical protein
MKTCSAKTENKFAAILQARHEPTGEGTAAVSPAQGQPVTPAAASPALAIGRPGGKGKKRDPNFRQVTAYIPRELHTHATIALRLANQERIDAEKEDFSELLSRLLADWYQQQTFYRPGR